MIKGFLRVASRAVAIQLEEAAAATAAARPYIPVSPRSAGEEKPQDVIVAGSGHMEVDRGAGTDAQRDGGNPSRERREGNIRVEQAWLSEGQVFQQPGEQVGLLGGRGGPRPAADSAEQLGAFEAVDPGPETELTAVLHDVSPATFAMESRDGSKDSAKDLVQDGSEASTVESHPSTIKETSIPFSVIEEGLPVSPSAPSHLVADSNDQAGIGSMVVEDAANVAQDASLALPSSLEKGTKTSESSLRPNPDISDVTSVDLDQLGSEVRELGTSADDRGRPGSANARSGVADEQVEGEGGSRITLGSFAQPELQDGLLEPIVESVPTPTTGHTGSTEDVNPSAASSPATKSYTERLVPLPAETFESLPSSDEADTAVPPTPALRPSRVPSSRIGRLFHYGSLVAGLSMGAASEYVRRTTGGGSGGQDGTGGKEGSVFMSEANVRRLVGKLSQMRGAALKLGQFMSIQDTNVLPEQLERVLQQVQAQADYMPDWQMDKVMRTELGSQWEESFSTFDRVPLAAASIGQVHRGVLSSTGQTVAIKIQFPGVQQSISSDLDNLSLLLRTSALLPRGLYLDNTLRVMRGELADECDYAKEAENGRRMRDFLKDEDFFEVPRVVDELSTGRVLTTEMMSGKPLSQIKGFTQEMRDKIGSAVLRLCLLELFRFRLMQTDPNWANFLYDRQKDKLQLIDFGATREYSVEFMDQWYRLLKAVMDGDREEMQVQSQAVGYLTGEENEEMVNAHLRSMELLAVPFLAEEYDFSRQSVTDEVRTLIPTMLKHRLTPPPKETYSLNRKLSGSFLLCAKLGSRVRCRDMWEEVVGSYKVST